MKKWAHARTNADLVRRLMHNITVTDSGCWEFVGARDRQGYGIVNVGRAKGRTKAHRLAWWLRHDDPGALCVLHRCDNPPCCNPRHLFLGTVQDNNADRVAKGRSARTGQLAGEDHPFARLTAAQVGEIRRRVAAGERQSAVAREFGVDPSHISKIVSGRKWRSAA